MGRRYDSVLHDPGPGRNGYFRGDLPVLHQQLSREAASERVRSLQDLGMEKKHICRVIFLETVFTFLITMAAGLILGILLDKLIVSCDFPYACCKGSAGVLYFRQLHPAKSDAVRRYFPADVFELHAAHLPRKAGGSSQEPPAGEKEPKAKWILAAIGVICLAAGYYIAVTTDKSGGCDRHVFHRGRAGHRRDVSVVYSRQYCAFEAFKKEQGVLL